MRCVYSNQAQVRVHVVRKLGGKAGDGEDH